MESKKNLRRTAKPDSGFIKELVPKNQRIWKELRHPFLKYMKLQSVLKKSIHFLYTHTHTYTQSVCVYTYTYIHTHIN